MNKIFKFLVFLLITEIILGYVIYLKKRHNERGYFSSSTFDMINYVNRKVFKTLPDEDEEDEKTVELAKEVNCNDIKNQNQLFDLYKLNPYKKKPINFQSDLEFINSFDKNKDYLILILGNSETFGSYILNDQKRLHSILQKKVRNKSYSLIKDKKKEKGKIFVINYGQHGGMIHDHLIEMKDFSNIYPPDLVIFYTGGNELILDTIFERAIDVDIYSLKTKKFYSVNKDPDLTEFMSQDDFEKCLDKNVFVTKNNFSEYILKIDIIEYIKYFFNKIDENLKNNGIDFVFYIQPLNELAKDTNIKIDNYNKIHNIEIVNENFINLNLLDKDLKLNYKDAFHTENADILTDFLLEDIWKKFGEKIQKKIND